jgi:uncharacterized protein (TIGR03067 family)
MLGYAAMLATLALSPDFAPAPFPKPDPNKEEMKKFQGKWVRVRWTVGGYSENEAQGSSIEVVAARLKYTHLGTPHADYSFTLDSKKKPAVFDFKGLTGPAKGLSYWGIYRLEEDTLTICYREGPAATSRPADFDHSKPGVIVSVYKRFKR